MEAASDKKPKVIIGCDHAAYDMKEEVKNHVISLGYEVEDIGTNSADDKVNILNYLQVDYPLYGKAVAEKVVKDPENLRGILLCGTGIGISISANKVKGIVY